MRAVVFGLAVLAVMGLETAAHAAETRYAATAFEVRNAAAVLNVIPEERTDIAASVTGGAKLPKFKAYREGARIVLDGGLAGKIKGCREGVIAFWKKPEAVVKIAGLGEVGGASLPVLTVRVPMDVDVKAGDAVRTKVGPSRSAKLAFDGCGDAELKAVAGALDLTAAGSGTVATTSAGSAKISVSGSGDVAMGGPVKNGLDAKLAGSGTLSVGSVSGGGVKAQLAGSGDLAVGAAQGPTEVDLRGSGNVAFASVNGPTKIGLRGSGDVAIGSGSASKLDISLMGSGDVVFGGVAGDVNAGVAGSGDVIVGRATGKVVKSVAGSGEVMVGLH